MRVGRADFGPNRDRLAVRAGQDADGGAWFAATDVLKLWPAKKLIADIHPEVIKVVKVTPFIEVRTDDFKRVLSDHCCTVDIYTYYGGSRGVLDGGDFMRYGIHAAEFSLKAAWHALDFEGSPFGTRRTMLHPDDEAAAGFTMPEDMPPLRHYRFRVNPQGTENPSGREGSMRLGWSRLAADWGVYALRTLASSSNKVAYGEILYKGEVDFHEVAEHFIYIGEQDW